MSEFIDNTLELRDAVEKIAAAAPTNSQQTVEPSVAAVITVEQDRRFFAQTLSSVLSQTTVPSIVIIADCSENAGSSASSFSLSLPHYASDKAYVNVNSFDGADGQGLTNTQALRLNMRTVDIRIVPVSAHSFAQAVDAGLAQAQVSSHIRFLWLLHDDSRPYDATYLETLVQTARNTPSAVVIGSKQLDWSGKNLHNVGYYAAPRHRVNSLVVDGEADQEQYDGRQDVYAVSLAGALVSLSEWMRLGPSAQMGTFGQSRDFCRRVCLSGGRVLVTPKARIAHRRARLEGIRTHNGEAIEEVDKDGDGVIDHSRRTYAQQIAVRDAYFYSDVSAIRWFYLWIIRLIRSWGVFIRLLTHKKPYQAWCELLAPWKTLVAFPSFMAVRRLVASQSSVSLRQLGVLMAHNEQINLWKERTAAFEDEQYRPILSSLACKHLRERRVLRYSLAILMMLVAFISVLIMYRSLLTGIFSGEALSSATLIPTGATMSQLMHSATTGWTYGYGSGTTAAPLPFLLVLFSVFTGGHVSIAYSVIVLAAAPCSAFAFWALAGIVTRSNVVRIAAGLVWASFLGILGLYATANLPMLVVGIFLPAAFAFVCKAVGMYRTDQPAVPTPSAQSAAWAALCFAVSVAAEPQLILVVLSLSIIFFFVVRSRRRVFWAIPIPSLVVIAPTLVEIIQGAFSGAYRQLFADAMIPSTSNSGTYATNVHSFLYLVLNTLGVSVKSTALPTVLKILTIITVIVLIVLALISLFIPSVLRLSRMMWITVLVGMILAIASSRITIAVEANTAIAGSALPGLAVAMIGLLIAACMVTGCGVKVFNPLSRKAQIDLEEGKITARDHALAAARQTAQRVLRIFMSLVLLTIAGVWSWSTLQSFSTSNTVKTSSSLPLISQDYLGRASRYRILTIDATSETSASYTVMRTSRGDIIDASPSVWAQQVSAAHSGNVTVSFKQAQKVDKKVQNYVAQLLADSSDEAIQGLSQLGYGAIYVTGVDHGGYDAVTSNIVASDGTEQVIDNNSGTYIRLSLQDMSQQGISQSSQKAAEKSVLRRVWIGALIVTALGYILVAFPRARKFGEERA